MVNYIPLIFSGYLKNGMMPRSFANLWILLQHSVQSLKRSHRGIGNGVSNPVIRTTPVPFGPHKIILPLTDKHEGTFDITFRRYFSKNGSIFKRDKTRKIIF